MAAIMASLTCSSTASWCTERPRASRAACSSFPAMGACGSSATRHPLLQLLRLCRGRIQLHQALGVVRGGLLVAQGTLVLHTQEQHVRARARRQRIEALDEGTRREIVLLL